MNEEWEYLRVYGYAPGNYTNKCLKCCKLFHNLDKLAIRCKACAEATRAGS